MKGYILVLALSSGLLHACVVASETPAQAPEFRTDAVADEEDPRNYIPLSENDLAPPSATVGGHERDGSGDGLARGIYRWRLHSTPELVNALRAALEVESDVMELHNAKDNGGDDSFDLHQSDDDWLSTPGANDGGLFGFENGRQLPKRAPTGFTGMRGRRIPSGFNGMRGKKSLSLFSWNNQALQSAPKSYRDGKRAPSGFLGMRGKKSIDTSLDEQWSTDDLSVARPAKEYANFLVLDPTYGSSLHVNPATFKRVPNGFMGLRGKK
uniref:Uncharacterized protein n=1 Tax=Anopheles atroparvus TaxID=41427 RepID=A0AAG5DUV6_ANOAO